MEEELRKKQQPSEEGQDQDSEEGAALPEGRAGVRRGETARELIRRARRASRKRFPAEEKIRIVMEGIRAEVSIADLCRREGIHPTIYYKWLKDFMEAGKGRLRGDAKREATSNEVQDLRQENERLKLLVADLSLENLTLKKSQY
ncbi:MAG TPA: transposase [Terracidiphilus sp.]